MPALQETTDGLIVLRAPGPEDTAVLIAGRDEEWRRFLGPGSDDPRPTACIVVAGDVVGWVDYDTDADRAWLGPGEVNVGYNVFGPQRGRGYASRAVQLLLHRLAQDTDHRTATLLIAPDNAPSLRLAERLGFAPAGEVDGSKFFRRPIPPLTYTDGVVTIRPQSPADIEADLQAKDDEQIDWMWLPGEREQWAAMTPAEQRAHALRGLEANRDAFGAGPKWTFAVDGPGVASVGYVDCDLANEHVPWGEANISYSAHPDHRGRGYAARSVRLLLQFLRDHTGAREAHIVVDAENVASRRVAGAVGAAPTDSWTDGAGRTMIRHVLPLR